MNDEVSSSSSDTSPARVWGDRSLRGIIQLPTLTRDADAAADGAIAQKLSRIKEQSYRMSKRERAEVSGERSENTSV